MAGTSPRRPPACGIWPRHPHHPALARTAEGGDQQPRYARARFWYMLVHRMRAESPAWAESPADLRAALLEKVERECVEHFIYVHRNCKPGQYQDPMVLGSTGDNAAYTYLAEDYGALGRERGGACFGFKGSVVNKDVDGNRALDDDAFEQSLGDLRRRGGEDVDRVAALGCDPGRRYHYTMVLDSDTVRPAKSIRSLIEVAMLPLNARHGIINASLLHDFQHTRDCPWHMWRGALIEV